MPRAGGDRAPVRGRIPGMDAADESEGNSEADLDLGAARREPDGHRLSVFAAIAAGGVLGAEARYVVGLALEPAPSQWPTATLLVNVSGCVLIGVLIVMITEVIEPHRLARPFLGVGLLGGYTTFSTYSVDVVVLHRSGEPALAVVYLAVTPIAALLAVWIGRGAARAATRSHRRLDGREAAR